ncbi:MgtC/SapB family protein [archaeon]|nr:MgtC/SapB family protein [archaeon]
MEAELWGIVVAIFLGALIGLQREYTQQHIHLKRFAGFRTFILITFFGAILGYLGKGFDSLFVIIGFSGIIVLTIVSYILTYMREKSTSATTEVAAIMVYVLGVMCTTGNMQLAIIFGILIVAFLTFKERFHNFAKKMEKKEMMAVVKFALVSLVVLPILPNRDYSPSDIPGLTQIFESFGINSNFLSQLNVFNFHQIWLMVILVAGISFVGYFLVKLSGSKRGYGLIGFVGGLVSSTAVTLSMAGESKKNKKVYTPFVIAVIVAMSVMFIRIIFEVAIVNSSLLSIVLVPLIVMAILGFTASVILMKKDSKKGNLEKIEFKQPFALPPALKFGLFFALILFVSKIMQILFGSTGLYITSILSGLADVDAITLSMASLSKSGEISNFVATTSIILAAASNTMVKAGMAYFLGAKKFGKIILGISLLILAVGLLVLFLI